MAPALLASAPALPVAPEVSSAAPAFHPQRYAQVIEPEWTTYQLTREQKLIFALREDLRPTTLLPALYSAGYEQLRDTDPKYGSDAGAGAAKFGASMARSGSLRLFTDGIFAPIFHQDPRYYRMAHGSIWRRGVYSAERALVRRGDNGARHLNYSGIAGRAAAAALTLAYYPPVSQNTDVVLRTFGYSILTDAGGDLVFEFLPDLTRKFPIIKKVEIE
jgi:hypothetical protein